MAKKQYVFRTNEKWSKVKQQVKQSLESPYCKTLLDLSLLICNSLYPRRRRRSVCLLSASVASWSRSNYTWLSLTTPTSRKKGTTVMQRMEATVQVVTPIKVPNYPLLPRSCELYLPCISHEFIYRSYVSLYNIRVQSLVHSDLDFWLRVTIPFASLTLTVRLLLSEGISASTK